MRFNPTLYSNTEWRAFRQRFLETHRICSVPMCGLPATEVDHVHSRRSISGAADFDPAGCAALCKGHHSQKTVAQDSGFGRTPAQNYKPSVKGCDVNGQPRGSSHWDQVEVARRIVDRDAQLLEALAKR